MRFLIIDNDPQDRELIVRDLQQAFPDGEFLHIGQAQALDEAIAQAAFDVVITDDQLGWTNGLEILQRVKQRFPHRPVLMVTRAGGEELAVEGMKSGLSDYVPKSRLSRLPLAVKESLEKARPRKEYEGGVEQFRLIWEKSADGMRLTNAEGIVLLVNEAFCRMVGKRKEELEGRPLSSIYAKEHQERILKSHRERFATRQIAPHLEREIALWNEKNLWFDLSNSFLEIEGQPPQLLSTFRDVTDRRRAQDALQESERRYRTLAESSAMGIWHITVEGYTIYTNPAMAALLEVQWPDELVDKTYHSFFSPESLLRVEIEHAKRRQGLASSYEAELIGKNGRKRNVMVSGAPLFSADGQLQSLIGTFTDITERKRAESALQASEDRYRELFENANDIIYTHDLEGNFTSVNKAGEVITGYSRQDALKMNITPCVTPEYMAWMFQIAAGPLTAHPHSTFDLEVTARDGRRVALEVSTRAIYQEGKPVGVQGIARDVTERRRLEAQLRHAQKMESIGTLAGGVAHDFNNVLTGIIGFSDLALRDLSPQHPHYRSLREIQRLGERAAHLTRQLLTFARKKMLEPKLIQLNTVIADLGQFIQRLIGEHIELKLVLADDLATLFADNTQIEQVLMNLCINARDAMPHGGKLIIETQNVYLDDAFCQTHPWAKSGHYIRLSVSDNGIGFDRATQERIFDPFFTTKGPGQGTGLGLAVVYAIVQQHRGMIDVYSELGGGAAFNIYLPADPSVAVADDRPTANTASLGSEMILVVEDEAVVRDLIIQVLQMHGYRVLAASNGEDALRLFDENQAHIALVITDAVMPKLSGRQVYEILRGRQPRLKFLFMSGYSVHTLSDSFVLNEGLDFMHKPFKPLDFARKVREVLDKAHSGAAAQRNL